MSHDDRVSAALVADEEHSDPYAERVLDAARRQFVEFGLRRTSLDEIARAADVGRATLFRRFANREALLRALAVREARRSIAAVDAQIAAIDDPQERVVTGFLALVRQITEHDLLRRLLVTDPEQMLPLLTVEGTDVLAIGRAYIAAQVRQIGDRGAPLAGDPDQVGELLARLALSLALNPETILPLDDDDQLRAFARASILPLVIARPHEAHLPRGARAA